MTVDLTPAELELIVRALEITSVTDPHAAALYEKLLRLIPRRG